MDHKQAFNRGLSGVCVGGGRGGSVAVNGCLFFVLYIVGIVFNMVNCRTKLLRSAEKQ